MQRVVSIAIFGVAMIVASCAGGTPPEGDDLRASTTPRAEIPQLPGAASNDVPVPLRDSGGVPDDFRDLWKQAATGGAQVNQDGYTYQYAVNRDRAAAIMIPRPIPRDDTVLVATISDLTERAFGQKMSAATPRLEATPQGNTIAFDVGRQTYYVLTIKNETREGTYGPGEPHTLLVWRENR
jgi:hypothetical protein